MTCGDGFKNRSRDVLHQSSGSVSFLIDNQKSNNESTTNNRSREVLQQPSGSGAFCPNIWEIVPCKAGSCIGSFLFYTYAEFSAPKCEYFT